MTRLLSRLCLGLWCFFCVNPFVTPRAASVNDCLGVSYAYQDQGFDFRDVPRQPRQGKPNYLITHDIILHDWLELAALSIQIEIIHLLWFF